jgi:hypothetical protein
MVSFAPPPGVTSQVTHMLSGKAHSSIPDRDRDFTFLESVQTGCGIHLSVYSMGTGSFHRDKAAGM